MRQGRKRGSRANALGRSRGDFGTKIHLRPDAQGLPLGFVLTPAGDHEATAFADLMALTGTKPRSLLGDRAYDADDLRSALLLHGILPGIPARPNRKSPANYDRGLDVQRTRIERLVGRLKECRWLATRYEKTADSFLGMLHLAAIRLWIGMSTNPSTRAAFPMTVMARVLGMSKAGFYVWLPRLLLAHAASPRTPMPR